LAESKITLHRVGRNSPAYTRELSSVFNYDLRGHPRVSDAVKIINLTFKGTNIHRLPRPQTLFQARRRLEKLL
jgi:hypothetical protein